MNKPVQNASLDRMREEEQQALVDRIELHIKAMIPLDCDFVFVLNSPKTIVFGTNLSNEAGAAVEMLSAARDAIQHDSKRRKRERRQR
jgi:hypothetical protein